MEELQFWERLPRVQLAVIMPRASKRRLKYSEHAHSFHELAFLIEGECNLVLSGKREPLRAGELRLVPAGARHYEITPPRAHARIGWIGFTVQQDDSDTLAAVPDALNRVLAAGEYTAEIRRIFEVICSERQTSAVGSAARTELALRELLILLCRLSPAGAVAKKTIRSKTARTAQVIHSAALTLTGNLAQPMRIRDLAHYHSLSASHFALLFRKHQGETPRQFLQKARLEKARALLSGSELNVKEIAAACGYVDAAHLCHAFKADTRLTPKQFRQRAASPDRGRARR